MIQITNKKFTFQKINNFNPSRENSFKNRDQSTVEEHYHLINHRPEVEGMDREDSGMGENMMVEVEVVEREHEGVVLAKHWTNDGVERHR
jgi:hypothetical protein